MRWNELNRKNDGTQSACAGVGYLLHRAAEKENIAWDQFLKTAKNRVMTTPVFRNVTCSGIVSPVIHCSPDSLVDIDTT